MKASIKAFLPLLMLLCMGCGKEPAVVGNSRNGQEVPSYNPAGNLVIFVDSLESIPFDEVETPCTHLCYAVYDMEGKRIKQSNQKLGDKHYGAVGMQLDDGAYQLVVLAHSGKKNPTMTNSAKIQFSNATGYSDTYLYRTCLDVAASQQIIHVKPRRVTALVRFVISDTVPDSIAQMHFRYTGGSGHLDASTGRGVTHSTQEVTVEVQAGASGIRCDLYTFPFANGDTLHLTATALDSDGSETLQREFNVPVAIDQISWLVGSFFRRNPDAWTVIPDRSFTSRWGNEVWISY